MLRLACLAAALVTLAACDATGGADQRLFEDEAYFLPPGRAGAWRIGPAFDARIQLLQPPTPNPASPPEEVSLVLDVSMAVPSGFGLYRLTDRTGVAELDLIQALPGQTIPWFYNFQFDARQADAFGRAGTYRLLVRDASNRVIAFGDFTIR